MNKMIRSMISKLKLKFLANAKKLKQKLPQQKKVLKAWYKWKLLEWLSSSVCRQIKKSAIICMTNATVLSLINSFGLPTQTTLRISLQVSNSQMMNNFFKLK